MSQRFTTSRSHPDLCFKCHLLLLACLLLCIAGRVIADDDGRGPAEPRPPRLASDAEQETWRRLNELTSVNWIEHTFGDAVSALAESNRLAIRLDEKSVPEEVPRDQKVTLKLGGAPLRRILRLTFEPFLLEAVIEGRGLVVTTVARANDHLNDWIYDISDLLHAGLTPRELTAAIVTVVAPAVWEGAGGKGTIRIEDGELHVRQASQTRSRLDAFLRQVRDALASAQTPGGGNNALVRNRFYEIEDLLSLPGPEDEDRDDLVSEALLIEELQSAVLPPTWRARGGDGQMDLREGRLLVRQTKAAHAALADFLLLLRTRRYHEKIPLSKSEIRMIAGMAWELSLDPLATRVALDRPRSFHVDDTPWPRIFRSLLKDAGLQSLMNREAIGELKLDENEKRSLHAVGEPLSSILDRFAQPLGVEWFVDEYGHVRITTPKEAAAAREIRLHPITRPLDRGATRAKLISQITSTITPELWNAPDRLTAICPLGTFLVVNHNRKSQDEIDRVLRATGEKQP